MSVCHLGRWKSGQVQAKDIGNTDIVRRNQMCAEPGMDRASCTCLSTGTLLRGGLLRPLLGDLTLSPSLNCQRSTAVRDARVYMGVSRTTVSYGGGGQSLMQFYTSRIFWGALGRRLADLDTT